LLCCLFWGVDAPKPRAAPCAWVLRPFRAERIGACRGQFRLEIKNMRAFVAKPRAVSCAWVLRPFRARRIGAYRGQFRHAFAFFENYLKTEIDVFVWSFLKRAGLLLLPTHFLAFYLRKNKVNL